MKLYQYLNFDEKDGKYFRLETVRRNKLWQSNPTKFNDPQELKYTLDKNLRLMSGKPQKIYDFINEILSSDQQYGIGHSVLDLNLLKDISTVYGGILEQESELTERISWAFLPNLCAIACFSEERSNPLMWAHYGKGHSGFCVTYEINDSSDTPDRYFLEHIWGGYLRHVNYVSRSQSINHWDLLFGAAFEKVLCTKSIDWAYEKEVRYIVPNLVKDEKEMGTEIDLPAGFRISEITAGVRISPENLQHLKHAVEDLKTLTKHDVKLTKAVISKSDFGIEIRDIE